jgi:hypothetical protein
MSFILSEQLDADESSASALFEQYQAYVRQNQAAFPASAFELASSGWFFGSEDHRAPHDAWLESMTFEEPSSGARSELRHLALRVKLLGAYHDLHLELYYPRVYSYSLNHPQVGEGHFDWRYHELRLSEKGTLIHEIEWAGRPGVEGRWILEVSDVQFSSTPRSVA